MNKKNMDDIVHFTEFLIKTVKEEEKRGNKNAKEMLLNYLEVINDGIQQFENNDILNFQVFCEIDPEYLQKLKQAQRMLK